MMNLRWIVAGGLVSAGLLAGGCATWRERPITESGQHPCVFKQEVRLSLRENYLLYLPDGYATSKREWPLILFLHGAGERGDDPAKIASHGPPKMIARENHAFPFIIVSPQCPAEEWWSNPMQVRFLNALLDDVVARYRVDRSRIYLTGLSMGGFGTWSLAAAHPERFAAIAPICGGGDPAVAARLAGLPIWVFHGAKDPTVPLRKSEEMVEALKKAGADVKFTVYPEAAHDSWSATYANPGLYDWFLQHRNKR